MDRYTEKFVKAQAAADKILMLKKNVYLNNVGSSLYIDSFAYVPNIKEWYRLKGYREMSDRTLGEKAANAAVSEWIRATALNGDACAFAAIKSGGALKVMYGAGRGVDTESIFRSKLPECEMSKSDWNEATYSYNGILVGTLSADHPADVIASLNGDDLYACCVVIPCYEGEAEEKLAENESLISYLNEHKSYTRVYGNASRRVEEITIDNIVRAAELLKAENDYITSNLGRGFVRCAVRFGASDFESYRMLVSALSGCMSDSLEPQSTYEPVHCFDVAGIHTDASDCLAIPRVVYDNGREYAYPVSWQMLGSAASFSAVPIGSYPGFYVKSYSVDENSLTAFPASVPIREPGAVIGSINSGESALVPYSSLQAHMFVTGATATGKTTTVKKTLGELYDNGIGFTVIEAAKKEYISLLSHVSEMKVYTPGTDGERLMINPLRPEDGVLIENHADAIVRAITAANGGEHPIPEAFDGLLKQTYEKAGWRYGMMAYTDTSRPFPTFKDVYDNIPEYIEAHAKYGPEVRKNLEAALTIRAENLYSGALGRLFSDSRGLSARELLSAPSVIELADFSAHATEFIMNILMYKFHCYLSRLPESLTLKRVIVIEEAHNIFKKTSSEESTRAVNNDYFEKMLAEIRSSGTGLILSDQRPSIMSDAVIANTSIKLVHSLGDIRDRRLVGESMNLSEFQIKKLSELGKGECVIGIRDKYGVQRAQVEPIKAEHDYNAACHMCKGRARCRKTAVVQMISDMDSGKICYHVARIAADPYDTSLLARNINNMLCDLNVSASKVTKCCLLAELLRMYGKISFGECRVIVNLYSEYLRSVEDA